MTHYRPLAWDRPRHRNMAVAQVNAGGLETVRRLYEVSCPTNGWERER